MLDLRDLANTLKDAGISCKGRWESPCLMSARRSKDSTHVEGVAHYLTVPNVVHPDDDYIISIVGDDEDAYYVVCSERHVREYATSSEVCRFLQGQFNGTVPSKVRPLEAEALLRGLGILLRASGIPSELNRGGKRPQLEVPVMGCTATIELSENWYFVLFMRGTQVFRTGRAIRAALLNARA